MKNKLKQGVAIASMVILSKYSIGQSMDTVPAAGILPDSTKNKTEIVSGSLNYLIEAEAMAAQNAKQSLNVYMLPGLNVDKDRVRGSMGANIVFTNDMPNGEFALFCTRLQMELAAKFGTGELVFRAGKMQTMIDVSSLIVDGRSIGMENKFFGQGGAGIIDNAVTIGYKTAKGSVDVGYVGQSNDLGVTIFDFGRFNNGQMVVIGTVDAIRNFTLRAKVMSDFGKNYSAHINAKYSNKKIVALAEYINVNGDNNILNLTVQADIKKKFDLFLQALTIKSADVPVDFNFFAGLNHKRTGIYGGLGANYNGMDDKLYPALKFGFTNFGSILKSDKTK